MEAFKTDVTGKECKIAQSGNQHENENTVLQDSSKCESDFKQINVDEQMNGIHATVSANLKNGNITTCRE